MGRQDFLSAIRRQNTDKPVFGTGTSIVCHELMSQTGVFFPEAHTDAHKMAALAMTGKTQLDFDVVMPLFSVCHEASAMGCNVNWGSMNQMPESGKPIFKTVGDIAIPNDLVKKQGCAVPLKAISLLKKELDNSAAVCGKVFGSWTQAYHYFGIEDFLIMTLTEPDNVKRILEKLKEVTIKFAHAQIEAGADCLLLADHATRDLCSPAAYREFLASMHAELAAEINVPLILHICGDTSDRIGMVAQTGLACFHWDTRSGTPAQVRRLAGEKLALMGGINNTMLLNGGTEEVASAVNAASRAGIDVIGPECAVPLTTPLRNLKAIAETVL